MPHAFSSLLHRLVAVMLAAGVSLCCCRTNAFVHPVEDAQPLVSACGSSSGSGCCRTAEDEDPSREREHDPSPAPSGCQTCCVKGSGLKDGVVDLPARLAAILPPMLPGVEIVPLPAAAPAPSPPRTPPAHAGPPTLLRLRCALIV